MVSSDDGKIVIIDLNDYKILNTIYNKVSCKCVAVNSNDVIASGWSDNSFKLYHLHNGVIIDALL